MKRVYTHGVHNFFDDLVTMLVSLETFAITSRAYSGESVQAKEDDEYFSLGGVTVPADFRFYPAQLMREVIANRWPTEIELEELPMGSEMPPKVKHTFSSSGVLSVTSLITQASFVRYFEKMKPTIEAKYGESRLQKWPNVWNFGRVVRNAFAHGGEITFLSPNAPSVTWRGLIYSSADNGKQIMYHDIAQVETIILMEEMDKAI